MRSGLLAFTMYFLLLVIAFSIFLLATCVHEGFIYLFAAYPYLALLSVRILPDAKRKRKYEA
jgi:hypothetical protein